MFQLLDSADSVDLCCLSYICSRMPQPCPSCPETRCSHLRHLPTVYWARGQFFFPLQLSRRRPPPATSLPAQQGGGRPEQQPSDNGQRERRAVSDSGRGCTFHIFTPQIPPPDVQTSECSSTPPPAEMTTHPRTHAHMHTHTCNASPLGGEIVATKPFC